MSAQSVWVIYGAADNKIRRVIVSDGSIDHGLSASAGELWKKVPLVIYRTLNSHTALVNYLGLAG